MRHFVGALVVLLSGLAVLAFVAPCPGQYCGNGRRVNYTPAATYVGHARHNAHHQGNHVSYGHGYDFKVRIADVVIDLIDVNTRDVFFFAGPPATLPANVVVGTTAAGQEAALVPAQPTPVAAPVPPRKPAPAPPPAEDELSYEDGDPNPAPAASPLLSQALASLTAGRCAACHTGATAKGGVVLFDAPGRLTASPDWKAVLAAVDGPDATMPPKGPRLTKEQVEPLRRLAVGR